RVGLCGPHRAAVEGSRGRVGNASRSADRSRAAAGLRGGTDGAEPSRHGRAPGPGEDMRAALPLLFLLGSCSKTAEPPASGSTKTFVDMRGKSVTIAWPPKRIVSLVPSL